MTVFKHNGQSKQTGRGPAVQPAGRRCTVLVCAVGMFVAACPLVAAEPEVVIEMSGSRIYQGESVLYRVTLRNVDDPTAPALGDMKDFDVQPRGDRSLNSHSIQIINGHRTERTEFGHAFDYLLTPRRAGNLTIPAPTFDVDGQTVSGEERRLTVVAPETQDMANIEITADKLSVYPMQPFTVQLKITVKPLPDEYAEQNPVAVLPKAPALSIPWVDESQVPSGLEPERAWRQWLGKYQDQRGKGFSINNIGSEPVFSFSLFDDGPMGFLPPSERIELKDAKGDQLQYWQFTLPRTFTAKEIGQFQFGPVTLKGTFVKTIDSQRQFTGQDVYAVAEPLTMTVKEPPLDGRPADYTGAIGRFAIAAQLSPTKAKVGDPMTLTLTLRGEGTRDAVRPPDLEAIPEVAESFKVYDATEQDAGEARQFTYSLRPLKEGTASFPPVGMTYFDVDREEYVSLNTKPIPLEIGTAEVLSGDEIMRASVSTAGKSGIESQVRGLRANDSALKSLRNDGVCPEQWFAGLGSLAGVYLILMLVTQKIQKRLGDPVAMRRRQAASRAVRRLREARQNMGEATSQASEMRDALAGLVADVANVPEAGLTTGDLERQLKDLSVEPDLIQRLARWCEDCDAARYGASRDAVRGLADESEELLDLLIRSLRQQRQLG